jgi:pyruvate dehydrogenase E2 component (dihydrolipoamide acetyltransferase)
MADFLMPSLGADMESAKVAQWLVQPGARVKPGDVVVVVETHKGAIDVEIFLDGLLQDLAPVGTDLPVGGVLAHVAEASSAVQAPAPAPAPAPAHAPLLAPALPPTPPPVKPVPEVQVAPAAPTAPTGARIKASPAARQLARELQVPVDTLSGTGVQGSVVRADVQRAAMHAPGAANTSALSASPRAPRSGFDPALMRQAIATAMTRSKREIPHYYLSSTIDFETANTWLEAYNRDKTPPDRLLPATLLIKASAMALREVPQLNGFYEGEAFRPGTGIHLGWAIALRGGGLVAPAIHDADKKSLPELMLALRDLVQRARSGGLRSSELTDPTVTVTSLGDRGADGVLGVIYPPQVAIVGFGRLLKRPWVVDDQVVPHHLLSASLAADHRASDGHLGGQLLAAIDKALQNPEKL